MNHIQTLFASTFCIFVSFGSFSQSDVLLENEKGDPLMITLDNGSQAFVFEDPRSSNDSKNTPLVDEKGNNIIVTLDDGTKSFVFPDPTFVYVPVDGVKKAVPVDVPFVDKSGNSIIVTLEDGTQSFIFPDLKKD